MDFSKLSQNNQIAAGGTLVTLISGFLPWFSVDVGLGSATQSGFGSGFFGWAGILLTIAGGVILLLKVLDVQDLKVQNLSAEQLAMVLAAIGLLFIVLRVLFKGDDGSDILGVSLVSRSWGQFVGLVGSAATLAGTVLSGKDQGIGLPSADDFTGGTDTGTSDGTSTF